VHVLHLLPADDTRGAQRYARALVDEANMLHGQRHEIAVIFDGPSVAAHADIRLGVRSGRLHAAGLDLRAVRRVRRLVRALSPDVVVAHGGEAQTYAALLPRRQVLVCLAIGVSPDRATSGWRCRAYRWIYRRADLLTAVSGAVADHLSAAFGLPRDRVTVMVNARDPARFRLAGERPGAPPRLAFVGHLTATKRPDMFVEVVRAIRAQRIEIEAVMAGDGPMLDSLRAATDGEIELLGAHADVAGVLAGASILCFTSASEGEGMPGVLIEAAMSGLPVVATDVPGVREVVRAGRTGIVVPEDGVDAFVAAVRALVLDPALRSSMGRAARAHAVERFSLRSSAHEWVQSLTALTSGSSGR
jgi:glycosyltransferase involved in cell wall biosynthesis